MWGRRRTVAIGAGVGVLALVATAVVVRWRPFVTALRDQQLEWTFLDRAVPQLPRRGTLLAPVEIGGRNLDAFPEFLLRRDDKTYRLVDVRRAAAGAVPWPAGDKDELLFYQGMYCYFAFPDEPAPDPITAPCQMIHERYATEPWLVEHLDTEGSSALSYAHGPFRIGFYRLRERTAVPVEVGGQNSPRP
jgi:hypothetical protein